MIIKNAILITWENPNRILENQAIYISGGVIKEIGPMEEVEAKYPGSEVIDAHSQYIMPGNICAHTHFYGAFARGLGIAGSVPADFPEILEKLWWKLDKALSLEAVRYSTYICLIDAIRNGTTSLVDHHASPNAVRGSLHEIAGAVSQSGLRAILSYEVSDRIGMKNAREGIEENVQFIDSVMRDQYDKNYFGALFGLHASLTLSDDTLKACRDAVGITTGFHIHAAEHPVDEYDSIQKYGMRVIDRLHYHQILGPKTIVAHAVHADVREIEFLADTGTWVTHQPRSNMNNGVGLPDIESMMRAGVKICLGNDGFSHAMWEEWKACYFAHKLIQKDPRRMPASTISQIAVMNNANLVNSQIPTIKVGMISPGYQADLIFVNYFPFTPLTTDNLPWHIVFGFNESMIIDTMVAGKFLMRNRILQTLDEEEILFKARKISADVWQKFGAV